MLCKDAAQEIIDFFDVKCYFLAHELNLWACTINMIPKQMEDLAQLVIDNLPKTQVFCLFIFSRDNVSYVSNADKEDILNLLKEFVEKIESEIRVVN